MFKVDDKLAGLKFLSCICRAVPIRFKVLGKNNTFLYPCHLLNLSLDFSDSKGAILAFFLANKARFSLDKARRVCFPWIFSLQNSSNTTEKCPRCCEDNKKTMQIYAACCCDQNHTPIDLAYQEHMSCFAHYETNPVVTAGRGDFCDILCCQRHL